METQYAYGRKLTYYDNPISTPKKDSYVAVDKSRKLSDPFSKRINLNKPSRKSK